MVLKLHLKKQLRIFLLLFCLNKWGGSRDGLDGKTIWWNQKPQELHKGLRMDLSLVTGFLWWDFLEQLRWKGFKHCECWNSCFFVDERLQWDLGVRGPSFSCSHEISLSLLAYHGYGWGYLMSWDSRLNQKKKIKKARWILPGSSLQIQHDQPPSVFLPLPLRWTGLDAFKAKTNSSFPKK